MKLKGRILGVAAVTALSFPLMAQTSAEPIAEAPEAADVCELHVWSAEDFWGLPFGGIFSDMNASTETQFTEIATAQIQIAALEGADLVAALGLPEGTQIVTHSETEENRVTRRRKERRSDSDASCYYELHMRQHSLIEDIVWGDRFTTEFEFRMFSEGDEEYTMRHRGSGGNKLTVFPVRADADPDEVLAEVSEAIAANFTEYAPKAQRRLDRERRRR